MRKIKIWYTDFWQDFDMNNTLITRLLKERYELEFTPDNPDMVFYSVFGWDFLRFDCPRIFWSWENVAPDFNLCDYAVGSDYLEFGERYMRFPLWIARLYEKGIEPKEELMARSGLSERKFCCFVYSNTVHTDPFRDLFFDRLSQYKRIDSGGGHRNNIGFRVGDKQEFCSGYKFSFAFENSSVPGYVTEKIMDSMQAGTIPIYWGDPLIDREFNPESFVWVRDKKEIDRAIEQIVELDNDEEKYLLKLSQPWFSVAPELYMTRIKDFLYGIADNPVHRRTIYGWNLLYEKRIEQLIYKAGKKHGMKKILAKIKGE